MKDFPVTKYFLYPLKKDSERLDVEFLDPRHRQLANHLKKVATAKGYKVKSLSEVCNVSAGKTADKYVDEGIPIIKLRNVTGNGIDWDTDYVEEEFFEANEPFHIHKNDVLLTSTGEGTIGRVDIYEKEEASITDGHVTALRVLNKEEILPKYLLYYLRTHFGQIQIARYVVGSTGQTELNDPDIKKIQVAYPKAITEQEGIVATVSKLENAAQEKEKEVDVQLATIDDIIFSELGFDITKEPQKYYTMQLSKSSERMDFEFNNPFYDGYYRELAKKSKYPFVELRQIVNFASESIDPTEKPDDAFQYVDIGNVDTRWGAMASESMMGFEMTSDRMRRIMHTGQILISTTRPTRRAIAIVPPELDNQVCSTGFAILGCKEEVLNEYLFHMLRSKLVTLQFERFSSGSGYPEINKEKDVPRIKVPCPDNKEAQKKIVDRINQVLTKARKLYEESIATRQQAISLFESYL